MSASAGRARAIGSELSEILAKTTIRDGEPLNIFRTLGHRPVLLKRFNAMGGAFLAHGVLPVRERSS